MPLSAGARLGPYEVLAPLGAGGMGEVYRARDPRLGRDVAIKVLPASFSKDPDRLKRFEQEARSAGVLNHPNVTIVYDIGQHDGAPYVVQELLEGETLRSELAGGRFSPRKAIDYAIQIAQGLAAAHEKGIIHRDLKPENLFVTKDGRVKILDFGLAKLVQVEGSANASNLPTATEPGLVMGTLGYMSPEQVKNEPADGRSDIFALGAILYEMLSAQRAFHGNSTAEIMVRILKEDPPDLSLSNQNVSPGLERLVRHCLEKNPERRFQSARDLAYDLETLTTASGATPAAAFGVSSRRWRMPLIAAALLASGILAGWGLHVIKQKPQAPSYKRITFRRGTVFTGRFASDGQTIVYSGSWEGEPPRIYAARAGSNESRGVQLPDARVLAVSPTGELAIQIGRQTVFDATGRLARVPLDGGAPRELLEDVSLADWSPDGRDLAVVHQVAGKDRLEFPIGKVLYESAEGIASARFSPRGERIAISQQDGSIALVEMSGKLTVLSKAWSAIGNLAWRPDGKEIWFSAQKPSEQYALYAVTLAGRERLVRQEANGLYLHDISRDGRVLLNSYLWSSNLLALSASESSERELSWMDQPLAVDISNDGRDVLFTEWGEGGGDKGTIYLRSMDGAPAVRLGEGQAVALSLDGRWVLSQPSDFAETFTLFPTGPGQPTTLEHKGITSPKSGRFLPDGKHVVFPGRSGKGASHLYVQDLEGGPPRAFTPDGMPFAYFVVSPDGRSVAALGPDSKLAIYPVDGGAARPLAGAEARQGVVNWSADGGSLYVYRRFESPARIFKIDITTGRRELWKTIVPVDRAGLITIDNFVMTPDARAYAYSFQRVLTNLEVVEGLR
jgi:Tol biopolymer transport system component